MSLSADGPISEDRALELVLAATAAWNRRDLRALIDIYAPDLTYWTNWGGPDNGPRALSGRQEYIRHLAALRDAAEIDLRLLRFRLAGNQATAGYEFAWRDPDTGLRHVFKSRNVITFSGDRISRIEVYQDATAMLAFQELIASRKQ